MRDDVTRNRDHVLALRCDLRNTSSSKRHRLGVSSQCRRFGNGLGDFFMSDHVVPAISANPSAILAGVSRRSVLRAGMSLGAVTAFDGATGVRDSGPAGGQGARQSRVDFRRIGDPAESRRDGQGNGPLLRSSAKDAGSTLPPETTATVRPRPSRSAWAK